MQSHVFWLPVTMHSFMKSSCARTGAARLAANAPTTRKDSTRITLPPRRQPLPAAPVGQYLTQVPLPIAAVSHSLFPAGRVGVTGRLAKGELLTRPSCWFMDVPCHRSAAARTLEAVAGVPAYD